ncbi:MAG: hypothetical protein Q4G09_04240 [Clostridia bacterium]|nr:hypothetical protein [Clostridia bacterium]
MKKLKLVIRINIIILLIITLSIVSRAEQIKQEKAKSKLEQAIKEVSVEEKTADISTVKDKIKKDVSNSKITNEDSTEFPIYTIVDGYEFKVEENNKIENIENNKPENIEEEKPENKENDNSDENIKNNNEKENNKPPEYKLLVEYQDDTKTDKGITISTTKDGIVTISGKSTEKLFIKISKNIKITDNAKAFEEWAKEDRYNNRKRQNNK